MLTDLTEYIKDWILDWDDLTGDCPIQDDPSVTYDDGLTLAYMDPIKGVLIKTSDESEYSGIDDRRGNFIYIRHLDDEVIPYNPDVPRVSSCIGGVQGAPPLRLVSVIRNKTQTTGTERYQIEEFLRNALINIDWTLYTGIEENMDIELTQGYVNSPQILDMERGPQDTARSRGFELRNIFVALDFILRYNYHGEPKEKI